MSSRPTLPPTAGTHGLAVSELDLRKGRPTAGFAINPERHPSKPQTQSPRAVGSSSSRGSATPQLTRRGASRRRPSDPGPDGQGQLLLSLPSCGPSNSWFQPNRQFSRQRRPALRLRPGLPHPRGPRVRPRPRGALPRTWAPGSAHTRGCGNQCGKRSRAAGNGRPRRRRDPRTRPGREPGPRVRTGPRGPHGKFLLPPRPRAPGPATPGRLRGEAAGSSGPAGEPGRSVT